MLFTLTAAVLALTSLSTAADVVGPIAAFQIYKAYPDYSMSLTGQNNSGNFTGNSTGNGTYSSIFRRSIARRRIAARSVLTSQGVPFDFHVSQDANNTNVEDLIVSFGDLPCPPASYGAYSFEFDFEPEAEYSSFGNGQINVLKINGPLPAAPTYNNIQAITGSLIGTFELPTEGEANQPRLIFINQLVCEPTINLRFGLTQYSNEAGSVMYMTSDSMGLRERSAE